VNNMPKLQTLYTEKLTHYNEWLMDSKRPFGKPYPGFPKDREIDALSGSEEPETIKVPRVKAPVKVTSSKAKSAKTGTKLDAARKIFSNTPGFTRAQVIAKFMEDLGMSKSGATTYWYNVQK